MVLWRTYGSFALLKRVTVVKRDARYGGVDHFIYEAPRLRTSVSHTKRDNMCIDMSNPMTEEYPSYRYYKYIMEMAFPE